MRLLFRCSSAHPSACLAVCPISGRNPTASWPRDLDTVPLCRLRAKHFLCAVLRGKGRAPEGTTS